MWHQILVLPGGLSRPPITFPYTPTPGQENKVEETGAVQGSPKRKPQVEELRALQSSLRSPQAKT